MQSSSAEDRQAEPFCDVYKGLNLDQLHADVLQCVVFLMSKNKNCVQMLQLYDELLGCEEVLQVVDVDRDFASIS